MVDQSLRGLQMAGLNQADALNNQQRLKTVMGRWQQHPGSIPGGTGTTGLAPNDAQGWSTMLNDNTWAQEQLTGKPMNVEFGGYPEGTQAGDISTAGRGQYDPANAGALQGLQQAYGNPRSPAQKAQAASELQRRFPFQYGRSPWGLG